MEPVGLHQVIEKPVSFLSRLVMDAPAATTCSNEADSSMPLESPERHHAQLVHVDGLELVGVLAEAGHDQPLAIDALDDGHDVEDQEPKADERRENGADAAERQRD